MNNTLRIAMECHPLDTWFEDDSSGNGVAWHGRPAWQFLDLKSRIGLEYDVITDLPPRAGNMYSDFLALVNGDADMAIDYWGVNYDRILLIDYSHLQSTRGVYIFSGRKDDHLTGNVVKGVFDNPSYGVALMAVVLMVMVAWCILQREGYKTSPFTVLFHMVGNSLNQPLNQAIWPKNTFGQLIVIGFSLYNLILCAMYSSVIISILSTIQEPKHIDSLSDLQKTENQDIRIFLKKMSYVPGYMNTSNMLEGLQHRIDYINPPLVNAETYLQDILQSVRNGSHVYISSEPNFNALICPVNKAANETLFRKAEYRKSRSIKTSI